MTLVPRRLWARGELEPVLSKIKRTRMKDVARENKRGYQYQTVLLLLLRIQQHYMRRHRQYQRSYLLKKKGGSPTDSLKSAQPLSYRADCR